MKTEMKKLVWDKKEAKIDWSVNVTRMTVSMEIR